MILIIELTRTVYAYMALEIATVMTCALVLHENSKEAAIGLILRENSITT